MSINLTNLKLGRQTTIEDTEHTVTKVAGGYELLVGRRNWKIAYDKPAKVWTVASRGEEYTVRNATAETVLDRALELVAPQEADEAPDEAPEVDFNELLQQAMDEADLPEDEPAEQPVEPEASEEPEPEEPAEDEEPEEDPEEPETEPELTDERRAALEARVAKLLGLAAKAGTPEEAENALAKAGALMDKYAITEADLKRRDGGNDEPEADNEEVVEIGIVVDTTGGFGPYRVLAMATVAGGFDVEAFWTQAKGDRYHGRLVLHLVGQRGLLTHLKAYLPAVLAQAELLAKPISRTVSREWRLAGKHHSLGGFLARADFVRGFATGVAMQVAQARREALQGLPEDIALMVRDWRSKASAYMAANHPNLKVKEFKIHDSEQWYAGLEQGRRSATPAVTEGNRQPSTELALA